MCSEEIVILNILFVSSLLRGMIGGPDHYLLSTHEALAS